MASPCDHPPICPAECTHCLAFDKITRSLCSLAAERGSKWCAVHEEIQAKMLKSYKRLTLAIHQFDNDSLPPASVAIGREDEMLVLQKWSEACRYKFSLIDRVIVGRKLHHDQFYAGGDSSHSHFVDSLKGESCRLLEFMTLIDKRAYGLSLVAIQAEWILTAEESSPAICHDVAPALPPTPPASPKSISRSQRKSANRRKIKQNGDTDVEACCDSPEHEVALSLLSRLRNYLVVPKFLPASIEPSVYHRYVSSIFRYVILRLPTLLPIATQSQLSSIEEFLDLLESRDLNHTGEGKEVEKLWRAMKFATQDDSTAVGVGVDKGLLGVGIISNLLYDLFRKDYEATDVLELLGGKLYRTSVCGNIPDEGYDLFYQFIACAGCSLAVTCNFAAWTRNRRLAIFDYLAWLSADEIKAERIFRLARIIVCASNNTTAKKSIKRIKQRGSAAPKRSHIVVEEWERPWIALKAPIDDPWILKSLEVLAGLPRFDVLARQGSSVIHTPKVSMNHPSRCTNAGCSSCGSKSSEMWLSRVRSSSSMDKKTPWTDSTFFPIDTILDSFAKTSPERRYGFNFAQECVEMLIMDNRSDSASGNWVEFVEDIASVISKENGCKTVTELTSKIAREVKRPPPSNGSLHRMFREDVVVTR